MKNLDWCWTKDGKVFQYPTYLSRFNLSTRILEFETIVTNTGEAFLTREVDLPYNINATDFEMPFSVRINNEANVFLCSNSVINNSNCYWIVLGGWEGRKTAIRKCPVKELLYSHKNNFSELCSTPLSQTVVSKS